MWRSHVKYTKRKGLSVCVIIGWIYLQENKMDLVWIIILVAILYGLVASILYEINHTKDNNDIRY